MARDQAQTSVIARWRAARRLFPVYSALASQFGLQMPPCRDLDDADVHSEPELLQQLESWFNELDQQLQVHQFRQLLHGTGIAVSEEKLHALIDRHFAKATKSDADREKLDFLLVQYFAVCAPPSLQDQEIGVEDVAEVLRPVLGDCGAEKPECVRPLDQWISTLWTFTTLQQLEESHIVQHSRQTKIAAGQAYFTPAALVAFTHFSYLLRCAFRTLTNNDLNAIEASLVTLESRGRTELDCSALQLPAKMPLIDLRHYCENFRRPAAPEYSTENAIPRLISIRDFLERAIAGPELGTDDVLRELEVRFRRIEEQLADLRKFATEVLSQRVGTQAVAAAAAQASAAPQPVLPAVEAQAETPVSPPAELPAAVPAAPAENGGEAAVATPPSAGLNLTKTIEEIRRRLSAGSRRGISSLAIAGTVLLLTAEEVEAFVRPSDSASADLQRSLAARALLLHAIETQKRTGRDMGLGSLLEFCRAEAVVIQKHSEQAKEINQHQATMLSASASQLCSLLRQAEIVAKSTAVASA